jgi:hypothetical protein
MLGTRNHFSIVTPVLDDWSSFVRLVEHLSEAFMGTDSSLDILAIDDGSSSTFDPESICLPEGSRIAAISILRLAVNLGHQRSIAIGLCHVAKRDDIHAAVVMDSDGEDKPEDVLALLATSDRQPNEVVLARRTARSETYLFRAGYFFYKLLFRVLCGRTINFGNFSLLPMQAVRRLVYMPELWNSLAGAVIRSRLRYTTVPIKRGKRYAGTSKMNVPSLIVHGLSAMSVYTDIIFVRVLLSAALVAGLSALSILVIVLIRLLTELGIPGWASTVFGDLVIILMQTFVMITAASLMVLNGRSQRPIIPMVDSPTFVLSETHFSMGRHRETDRSTTSVPPVVA